MFRQKRWSKWRAPRMRLFWPWANYLSIRMFHRTAVYRFPYGRASVTPHDTCEEEGYLKGQPLSFDHIIHGKNQRGERGVGAHRRVVALSFLFKPASAAVDVGE